MDSAQVEQELEDLEAKLERLRSLYEQYFLGMEKLEPTVPRKDVDRKFWVLRREQIRNTGLRFKFQSLVQRYNTYQQYWTRVVREIENGTYRRDVMKVAQRFGEKEAMTILGRRRAEQFKRLAANQAERKAKRQGAIAAVEEAARALEAGEDDAAIPLDADDLEEVDAERDDAAETPVRALPPVAVEGDEPDMESLLLAATVGVKTWSPPKEPAAAPEPEKKAPPLTAAQMAKERLAGRFGAKKEQPAPAAGAAKSRVAELAAQMRARKEKPKDELALDQLFDPPPPPAPPVATTTPLPKPAPPAATSTPLPKPPPSESIVRAPTMSEAPPTIVMAHRPVMTVPPVRPTSSARPAPPPPPPPPPPSAPARKEDLSDQKMREIYAKYVGAKRAANESTAGITYDKLASSLRAQADKIRTTHPSRSVDFEVVTKDGKTALRPVLK